jgi:tRNA nucleotidyltransferase (CCA-adding enzyme)
MLALKRADISAQAPLCRDRLSECDRIEEKAREILSETPCFSVRDLCVDGKDIMALGVPKGPLVGACLAHLLDLVMAEKAENRREVLLFECERFFAEKS